MAAQNPVRPLLTHDTDGNMLPDWVQKIAPSGTVAVDKIGKLYIAINAAKRRLFLNMYYMHSFYTGGRPTHDMYGYPIDPAIANLLPIGAYNVRVAARSGNKCIEYCIRNNESRHTFI